MTRYGDWPRRLSEYLNSLNGKEFEWGVFDCCIMINDSIRAITGESHMDEFVGTYDDEKTAMESLRRNGAGTLFETLKAKFGEPLPGVQGQRGDIAYLTDQKVCGVVFGRRVMFIHEDGFLLLGIRAPNMKVFHIG